MAGITQDQRMLAWNVQFLVSGRPFAGIYQREDFLSVADVSRELNLCLRFPQPEGAWQAILLPIDSSRTDAHMPRPAALDDGQAELTIDRDPFILLDETDTRPFPTPTMGYVTRYRYAFHSASCDNPRHRGQTGMLLCDAPAPFRHPFPYTDVCIRWAGAPTRRCDPRYLLIKTKCTDERLRMAPLRNPRKRKASSDSDPTHSSAPSSSLASSDTGTDDRDEEVPVQLVQREKARQLMDKFRTNVLTRSHQCVVTGKGESWLGMGIGPGVEVAHIVPQCHWNTYPLDEEQRVADRDVKQELEMAWRLTWMCVLRTPHLYTLEADRQNDSSWNGLPLLSHIHKCFEARLLSIHPTTYQIRTFAWYDILNEYHGQIANISASVDRNALQHHWDMCCLENIIADSLSDMPDPPSNTPPTHASPTPIGPSSASTATPKAGFLSTSRPQAHGQSTSGTMGDQRHIAHKAPDNQVHPLSPLSSDAVVQRMRWRVGNEVITDPKVAERLRGFGWDIEEICTLVPFENTARPCNGWRIGREVITDPEVAQRLRSFGWKLEELPEETDEACSRPRKRQRRVPRWRIGAHIIEDEYEAQRLRDQGWVVETVLDDDYGEKNDGEENGSYLECGRPRKRRSAGKVPDVVDPLG